MQARGLAIGILFGVAACCLAFGSQAAIESDPNVAAANRLAHTLHTFHAGGFDEPMVSSEDDYCRYLWRALDLLHTLDQAAAAGNHAAARAADNLADELGEEREEFADDFGYYPCWPPNGYAFWQPGGASVANAWQGFYIGLNAGFGTGSSRFNFSDGSSGSISLNGISMGVTAGFNLQSGPWVPGVVATFNWSDISGSTNAQCSAVCSVTNNWLATVDGRVGYATGNILPYVKGGVAFGKVEQKIADFSDTTTKTGWNLGLGIEWKLDPSWSFKAEYMYVDLGKVACAETVCGLDANTPMRDNIFSVGLNWNWSYPGGPGGWGVNSSDARLKRDIVTLGHLQNGLAVYRFRYDGSDQVYVGLMAQEVQLVRPDAVIRGDDGYLLVDYGRLGLRMETWEEWVAEQEHRSKL